MVWVTFDPMQPFADRTVLDQVVQALAKFEYKLYGAIPIKFYGGDPTQNEFDLNLGMIHFTEADFMGLSAVFAQFNQRWGTEMTFCIYPAKESNREMIMNIRGSPAAPSDIS